MEDSEENLEETMDRYRESLKRIIENKLHIPKDGNKFNGAFVKAFIGKGEISDVLLDIETTGLSKLKNRITCISILVNKDSENQKVIHLINSDKIANLVIWNGAYPICIARLNSMSFEYIFNNVVGNNDFYTYNGKTFDVPFIKQKFNEFNPENHVDMRYVLKNCEDNLTGGQKAIENKLGFYRDDGECSDGMDAIRLFKKFDMHNNKDAFIEFMVYAFADVEGLRRILKWYNCNYEW